VLDFARDEGFGWRHRPDTAARLQAAWDAYDPEWLFQPNHEIGAR
jgi:hypothetical protein